MNLASTMDSTTAGTPPHNNYFPSPPSFTVTTTTTNTPKSTTTTSSMDGTDNTSTSTNYSNNNNNYYMDFPEESGMILSTTTSSNNSVYMMNNMMDDDDDDDDNDSTSSTTPLSAQEQLDAINYYGYSQGVEGSSIENDKPIGMSFVPGSPLPADRLARKQRNFPRRGGFVHNSLLRSAVVAASDMNNTNKIAANAGNTTATANMSLLLNSNSSSANNKISPRKRMRRTDHATRMPANTDCSGLTTLSSHGKKNNNNLGTGGSNHNKRNSDEAVIARATDLLEQLYLNNNSNSHHSSTSRPQNSSSSSSPVRQPLRGTRSRRGGRRGADFLRSRSGHEQQPPPAPLEVPFPQRAQRQHPEQDFERAAPVRRVSRRTSYSSQISTGTDYDDDLDEFH